MNLKFQAVSFGVRMATLPGQQANEKKHPLSNLTQRILTGVIVSPIVIALAALGGLPFAVLVAVITLVGMLEFYALAKNHPAHGSPVIGIPAGLVVIAAFALQINELWIGALLVAAVATFLLHTIRRTRDTAHHLEQAGMTLAGILYVSFPAGFLLGLRAQPNGMTWLLFVFAMTWGTDSFAYIGGRLWGKTKLAPSISPKKTLEGALVGIIGGIFASAIILGLNGVMEAEPRLPLFILMGIAPLLAIAGDLVESALKRFFRVKDSHITGFDIFPGHGGVLDRIDALILVATFTYFYIVVFKLLPI
jgi:phosphatidate cytidylyltransferase